MRHWKIRAIAIAIALALVTAAAPVQAQEDGAWGPTDDQDRLSALIDEALERNPGIAAAAADAEAAAAAISRAGAWDDPVLTLGFTNLPIRSFDFGEDFMTMKMVQVSQRIPLPGQIRHRRAVVQRRAASAALEVEQLRVEVASEVKEVYAELYYLDRALEITDRNLTILRSLERVTVSRYSTGLGRQPAVLRAGLEIDALEGQRIGLREARRSALARLNAVLDRPIDEPLEDTPYPEALLPLAGGERGSDRRSSFVPALDLAAPARVRGLPPLDSLIERATRERPALLAHVERIRGQQAAVRAAEAERWPTPHVMIGFAQRDGFSNMLNASVSFPLPIFMGAKQNAAVHEEESALAREHAAHTRMVGEIRRDVTAAYSEVVDAYDQLRLFRTGILIRAEANLDAALAAYRAGAEDFLALLDSQSALYRHQLEYHRRLSDLLSAWAELERAVGEEIRP